MFCCLLEGFFNSHNPYVFSLAWYFWLIMVALIALIIGAVFLIVHLRNKFIELEQKQEQENKEDEENENKNKDVNDKDGQ